MVKESADIYTADKNGINHPTQQEGALNRTEDSRFVLETIQNRLEPQSTPLENE